MALEFGHNEWFVCILTIIFLTDIAILLDIPFLRQVCGFLFLTILPGLLIIHVLKLNKIGFTEKFVLLIGLSISFLLFFGLLINNLLLSLGYEKSLSTIAILSSLNIAFIILAVLGYKTNRNTAFSIPDFELTKSEKVFLVLPMLFPALSILGTHFLKTTGDNSLVMFLIFLIPIYVVFVCTFNQRFPKRLYPITIVSISLALLLIFMLRFSHICGHDVHLEYGMYFLTTLDNLHWRILGESILDACLSISLLPTVYQSIMNLNAQEYLFKGIYVTICSFSPLAVYVIANKYIDELYAFLASFFFLSQAVLLNTAGSPRTNLAIFFVALALVVLYNDKISPFKKRSLFIIFLFSMVVSHYSTAYIFFFILLFIWVSIEIICIRYKFENNITLTMVLIFFAFIFFWHAQIVGSTFTHGVMFVEHTFASLNDFFIMESRTPELMQLTGKGLVHPILGRIHLIVTWGSFILIGIGSLTMLMRYREMVYISNVKLKKPVFLKKKFEMHFLIITLTCAGLMVINVAIPYVAAYGITRVYSLTMVILSVSFVIGGITLSKQIFRTNLIKNFFFKKKSVRKKEGGNGSEIPAYFILLVIVIPNFLFAIGAIHQICGFPQHTLSTMGEAVDLEDIRDQDSYGAKWLSMNGKNDFKIYTTDLFGRFRLISQGGIQQNRIDFHTFSKDYTAIRDYNYIYLYYNNVVNEKLLSVTGSMANYSDRFIGTYKVYDNGGSEVYKK